MSPRATDPLCSPRGTVSPRTPGPPCHAGGRAEPVPVPQVACMQFINIVVHSVENMNFRVFLQYEFTHLGLDQYLEVGDPAPPRC